MFKRECRKKDKKQKKFFWHPACRYPVGPLHSLFSHGQFQSLYWLWSKIARTRAILDLKQVSAGIWRCRNFRGTSKSTKSSFHEDCGICVLLKVEMWILWCRPWGPCLQRSWWVIDWRFHGAVRRVWLVLWRILERWGWRNCLVIWRNRWNRSTKLSCWSTHGRFCTIITRNISWPAAFDLWMMCWLSWGFSLMPSDGPRNSVTCAMLKKLLPKNSTDEIGVHATIEFYFFGCDFFHLIFGKSSNFFLFLPELWSDLSPISVLHMVLGITCSSVSGSLFFLFRCNDHARFVHIILSLIKVIDISIPHGEKLWVKTELFGNLLSKKGSTKACFLEHSML